MLIPYNLNDYIKSEGTPGHVSREKRTTIEINGRLYDAVTGQLLHQSESAKSSPQVVKKQSAMDGFVQQPSQQSAPNRPADADNQSSNTTQTREPKKSSHVHQRTKRSQTLNRAVVVPPPVKPKSAESSEPSGANNMRYALASQVPGTRKARAAGVNKSASISKFGTPAKPVANATASPHNSTEENPNTSKSVAIMPPTRASVPPAGPHSVNKSQQTEESVTPADRPSLGERANEWITKKRTASLVASALTAVLLIGYVTYLNIPRIALRVAAGRAGFEAEMPSYSPSGFAFSGPVAYSPGQITIQFSSNTDDRSYQITERETSWDSQTLLDNHVLEQTQLYSTYQERGLTIYVYDGSTATWVNGGIWYTVEGDSRLTAEQLLKIAASL